MTVEAFEPMITCEQCTAECCHDVTVEIDAPETLDDWKHIRWMVAHKNVSVYLDNEDDWVVEFQTPCDMLDGNRCRIYKTRPKICKDHALDSCVRNGVGKVEKLRFDTLDQVEKHIEETIKPKLKKKLEAQLKKVDAFTRSSISPLSSTRGPTENLAD